MVIDADSVARDTGALVAVPSETGDERAALECLGTQAEALGLSAELSRHDLDALRASPGYPGEEAPRGELWGLTVTRPGAGDGPRVRLNGHVDVVPPGAEEWSLDPWSGRVADGVVHGRGSVDMKGGVVAALHAMASAGARAGGEVVLTAVASEEDGGLGTFAALEADSGFDACLIPEPTGADVVCAQAGSLTFEGTVSGRGAHAGMRLEGESAIDRYVEVHLALAAHERRINDSVEHELMAALDLPYPINVGRVAGGAWASSVPDRVDFACRLGVRVGEDLEDARAAVREALAGLPVQVRFTGGVFAPAATDPGHPFARLVLDSFPGSRAVGVPWGADMRQYTERGIPTVMVGPGNAHLAHAVDERVPIADLVAIAEGIARVIEGFQLPSPDVDESALTERLITYDTSTLEGMQAAAAFIYGWLEARDVEVKGETHNGRPVLAATVGAAQGPTVVLHGHLDVVPGNEDQFTPRIEGDRLIGRGAYDMKGGLAAMMCAVRELASQDRVKVHFVCVSDEESDEQKHRASDFVVQKGYVGDFAITGEPTNLRIGIQAKGVLGLRLEVSGRSAHGSTPWLGDNAVLKAVDIFRAIESMAFTRDSSELFDRPSISLGKIAAGDAVNRVPDLCTIDLDIRYLPGQNPDEILAAVNELADTEVVHVFHREPIIVARDEPHVQVLAEAVSKTTPVQDSIAVGRDGTSDVISFLNAGIPGVEFGPAGDGHHGPDEWVSIESLTQYRKALVEFVGLVPALGAGKPGLRVA